MIKIINIFLFLVSVFLVAPTAVCKAEESTIIQSTDVPNPSDLKFNWWEYYDVDAKTLVEKKQATEKFYEKVTSTLSEELQPKVKNLCDGIIIGLQNLINLKAEPDPLPSEIDFYPDHYNFKEWLDIGIKYSEQEKLLDLLNIRLNLMNSSYEPGNRYLDSRFANYLATNPDPYTKLCDGLNIINGKILLTIEKIQIEKLRGEIDSKIAKLSDLRQEIDHSYPKVNFSSVSIKELEQEYDSAKKEEDRCYQDLFLLQEKIFSSSGLKPSSSPEKEIALQQLIAARIQYEIARIRTINQEASLLLLNTAKKKQSFDLEKIKKNLETWQIITRDVKREMTYWEGSSDLTLQALIKNFSFQKEGEVIEEKGMKESIRFSEKTIGKLQLLQNELFINDLLVKQFGSLPQASKIPLKDRLSLTNSTVSNLIKKESEWLDHSLFNIYGFPITVRSVLKVVSIIGFSIIFAKILKYLINQYAARRRQGQQASLYGFNLLIYYSIIVIGVLLAARSIGMDLTALAFIAGGASVGVGVAAQSIIQNVMSGIIILFTQNVRIHDCIQLESGQKGIVQTINLRTMALLADDGSYVIIPNSEVINKKVLNYTLSNSAKRIHIPFRIGLNEDRQQVAKMIIEAAKKIPFTFEQYPPEVWMRGYGDKHINVELVVWIKPSDLQAPLHSTESAYFWAVDAALQAGQISHSTT